MTAAIQVNAVEKSFGNVQIIRDLNLSVAKGERHAIIGPNGAGKSTTFNLISGHIKPTSGEIRLNGAVTSGLRPFEINRRGLSRSFQVTNVFARMTVWENVRCAVLWATGHRYAFWKNVDSLPEVKQRTAQILDDIHLSHRRDVPAGLLTYAEQRELEIGITIAGGASVIMLDEPTAGMTAQETRKTAELFARLKGKHTLIVVEHDMGFVKAIGDVISVMHMGQMLAEGTAAEVEAHPEVRRAYLGSGGISHA